MTKTGHALLALVMLVPSLANPQDRLRRLTLDEAIAVATRENPTLRAKTLEIHATRANEITAALRPNPSVSYSADQRSEEHTSELQSQSNLVCRLLLEKKKKKNVYSQLYV